MIKIEVVKNGSICFIHLCACVNAINYCRVNFKKSSPKTQTLFQLNTFAIQNVDVNEISNTLINGNINDWAK